MKMAAFCEIVKPKTQGAGEDIYRLTNIAAIREVQAMV